MKADFISLKKLQGGFHQQFRENEFNVFTHGALTLGKNDILPLLQHWMN